MTALVTAVGVALIGAFIALVPLYFCIRIAVLSAMKEHTKWADARGIRRSSAGGSPSTPAAPPAGYRPAKSLNFPDR